jgi:predicted RecB family nuclease
MKITSSLFDAFLKCTTKCHLRSLGEVGSGNEYAEWVRGQDESYQCEAARRLLEAVPETERVVAPPPTKNLKAAKWRLAVDLLAQIPDRGVDSHVHEPRTNEETAELGGPRSEQLLETHLQAIERVPSEGRGKPAQFIPIRFVFRNKLTKDDRLLLAFDALVLSQALGRAINLGKIIHGDDHATLKVKTSALVGEVRKRIEKIASLLSSPAPPDLVLNRHCAECEFQARCRKIAVEKDDLSLLGGMSDKERARHRSKGIFTITQLSYTFRPRRTTKRAKNPGKPRYLALQAMAIRENTVYIHGAPTIPQSRTQVFLDIEGLPDRDLYYMAGALVVSGGDETFHSFWADTQSDEPSIFAQLLETITQLGDYRVFHFGDYETIALKRVRSSLSEIHQQQTDMVLQHCTNVLSIIYPHVYFPTYSNKLKDIGRFLGPEPSTHVATGLESIIWRMMWSTEPSSTLKARLVDYNKRDCEILAQLTLFLARQTAPIACLEQGEPRVKRTDELDTARPRWRGFSKQLSLEGMTRVIKCAYFDYQREKVFVRTNQALRAINKNRRKQERKAIRHSKVVHFTRSSCPACRSKKIQAWYYEDKSSFDLAFSKSGVKRDVICYRCWHYVCSRCEVAFSSDRNFVTKTLFGPSLMSWCVYFNVVSGENLLKVQKNLDDMFDIHISNSQIYKFKQRVARRYNDLYSELLREILKSPFLHIDETRVTLRKHTGYVWVMTTMDTVYYFYRPSREGAFLTEMLCSFSGVLITDFYAAYDSLPCAQQKCLIHLVRELDDDLFHNPLDEGFKALAQRFGTLLRAIIETVDRYGLKKFHLHKHKEQVERFLKDAEMLEHSSELVEKYANRFTKYGSKLFTFLDQDGIPWNNNNAEHAIKRFARHRRSADGCFTERSRAYLDSTTDLA